MDMTNYLKADSFFKAAGPIALTYDDVSLATLYSEILPKQTSLETSLSSSLCLPIPILSSDMDTVTESRMAIAMALNGGLGVIHYNMTEKEQLREVARVKNHVHGLIQEPIKIAPNLLIGDVLQLIANKGYNFQSFPVVNEAGTLLGFLDGKLVKERYKSHLVAKAMTSRANLITLNYKKLGKDPIKKASQFFDEHMGINKLLIVDDSDKLAGLFTLSDVDKIINEQHSALKPARDGSFRLMCAAAISAPRTSEGDLDKDRILNHVSNLVAEGIDAIAFSTAHGHSLGVGKSVKLIRKHFKELTIIAGNVTSAEGVDFLAEAGADAVKVGQGPGSICTTRVVAGVGIPQLTALYQASKAKKKVKLIADGGITKSGDIVKALTLSHAVMLGGLLAGCIEAPGKIMEINGKYYKQYRGMGSSEAMKAGSAARYGHAAKDAQRKAAAEGIEALKEISDTVDVVLIQLIGGLQSGLGYLGAKNLKELHSKASFVRVTPAGQKESAPHDVMELKTSEHSL